MPRYDLNLRRGRGPGEVTVDPEGDEVGDRSLLRDHALYVARQVIRTPSHVVPDWMTCSFEIIDEWVNPVMTVPFSDLVAGTGR